MCEVFCYLSLSLYIMPSVTTHFSHNLVEIHYCFQIGSSSCDSSFFLLGRFLTTLELEVEFVEWAILVSY
jgi:hypothetical protein